MTLSRSQSDSYSINFGRPKHEEPRRITSWPNASVCPQNCTPTAMCGQELEDLSSSASPVLVSVKREAQSICWRAA